MSIEEAVVAFVVSGAGQATAEAGRVEVSLGNVDKAGRAATASADGAPRSAAAATAEVKKLQGQISTALGKLAGVASLAKRTAENTFGVSPDSASGRFFENSAGILSGAANGAQLGATGGPVGAGVGAIVGGVLGLTNAVGEQTKRAEQAAKKFDRESDKEQIKTVSDAILREIGLSKLGSTVYSSRQTP